MCLSLRRVHSRGWSWCCCEKPSFFRAERFCFLLGWNDLESYLKNLSASASRSLSIQAMKSNKVGTRIKFFFSLFVIAFDELETPVNALLTLHKIVPLLPPPQSWNFPFQFWLIHDPSRLHWNWIEICFSYVGVSSPRWLTMYIRKSATTRRHPNIRYARWWSRDGLPSRNRQEPTEQIANWIGDKTYIVVIGNCFFRARHSYFYLDLPLHFPTIWQSMNCLSKHNAAWRRKSLLWQIFFFFSSQERKSWSVPSDAHPRKITLFHFWSRETLAIRMSNFLWHFKILKLLGQIHLTSQWKSNLRGSFLTLERSNFLMIL